MKVLFFAINSVTIPNLEIIMELISDCQEKGDDVYVLKCNKSLPRCYCNPNHLKSLCFGCCPFCIVVVLS